MFMNEMGNSNYIQNNHFNNMNYLLYLNTFFTTPYFMPNLENLSYQYFLTEKYVENCREYNSLNNNNLNKTNNHQSIKKRVFDDYYSNLKKIFFLRVAQGSNKKIGTYSIKERLQKIIHYKTKQQKYRKLHPISRDFQGRSKYATEKYRNKGKFAKKKESLET